MSQENFNGGDAKLKQQALEHRRDSWNEQHENILRQWGSPLVVTGICIIGHISCTRA